MATNNERDKDEKRGSRTDRDETRGSRTGRDEIEGLRTREDIEPVQDGIEASWKGRIKLLRIRCVTSHLFRGPRLMRFS